MPTVRKCGPKNRKCVSPCKPKARCPKLSETILQEFVQHKTSVLVIMAAVSGLGALFATMLGVSAAHF